MNICFLGAGAFGKALAKIAEKNSHKISFYDPQVFPEIPLETAISNKDLIVYVAPSNKYPELLPQLDKNIPIICASKGFLSTKPFEEFKDFSALGGAAFSKDFEDESKQLTLTASSSLSEIIFSTENITIEYTSDTLGIMLCGALKNIYAIGAGIYQQNQADENCGPSITPQNNNEHLAIILPYLETAAAEIGQILEQNGATKDVLKLSCGIKDLVLTCSENSRNFRFGIDIVKNNPKELATIEGLNIINSLADYPDFVIPDSATMLKDIIEKVENYESEQNAAQ
ncbi:hypothetical protein IKF40_02590 [Candidatus Saccharibacteria bacterium]|nr:hypothetical protein [Candidatus Saccharibacteria bacterium]